jgi:hypothetical protein
MHDDEDRPGISQARTNVSSAGIAPADPPMVTMSRCVIPIAALGRCRAGIGPLLERGLEMEVARDLATRLPAVALIMTLSMARTASAAAGS